MKKLYNINKGMGRRFSATVLTLVASFLCATSLWAGKGFWDDSAWNFKYYDGADKWYNGDGIGMSYTPNLGVKTTLYFKGGWVKTWSTDDWTVHELNIRYYLNGVDRGNYTLYKDYPKNTNELWEYTGWNDDFVSAGHIGVNTVHMQYWLDSYVSADSYFNHLRLIHCRARRQ